MGLLAIHGLSLGIGGKRLVDDLSLELDAGENWAVLGANGSGKTTLLHCLAGLRRPDTGHVHLLGQDLHSLSPRRRAQQLGVLFQDTDNVFPATVLDTVMSGRHPHLARSLWRAGWQWETAQDCECARAALHRVGLADLAGRALTTLSGGERRRTDIAALLAQDPCVALLDEPTNHLDLHHQVNVLEMFQQRAQAHGHLNVMALHDVNLALRYCSHGLLLLGDGRYRAGRLGELLDVGILAELYGCRMRAVPDGGGRLFVPA